MPQAKTMGGTVFLTVWLWTCAAVLVAYGQNYVNVAPGKTYRQSSRLSEQDSPSGAANGVTEGAYNSSNCIHTAVTGDFNPWWEVDLGRTYPVHNVSVWPRDEYYYSLHPVNITVDGQLCAEIIYIPLDSHGYSVTCPGVMYGRTVRVTRQATDEELPQDRTLVLCELQIWVPSEVSECEAGRYGSSCDLDCPDHCGKGSPNNFCFQSSGLCYDGCESGMHGDQCSSACSPGCQDTSCHQQTANCAPCNPVYTGNKCSECEDGRWGLQCGGTCGRCREGVVCDRVTGHCPLCQPGWNPPLCDTRCREGWYGVNCSLQCARCPSGDACNTTTGLCPCAGDQQQCDSGSAEQIIDGRSVDKSFVKQTVLAAAVFLSACVFVLAATLWGLKFGTRFFSNSKATSNI